MVTKNQYVLLRELRKNARVTLTKVSRKHKIPVTTLFDNYAVLVKKRVISRHFSVLNFKKLGFIFRILVMIEPDRNKLVLDFIAGQDCVNNIKLSLGGRLFAEALFASQKEMSLFLDDLAKFDIGKIDWFEISDCLAIEKKRS